MSVVPEEVPKQVGRYVVLEPLGYGAMGAVYKAQDPLISRVVAIKTIRLDVPPDSPHYSTFRERFYTEARASGTLSHPNIVTLFDIGETEDKIPFLAMEYVDGETVAELLARRERLQPEQVVGLVSQIASAIDYAHSKAVIHRDIKPSNIMVYDGEKVKVTDFGIAKLMDADGTLTVSLLGTPSYMSPEQAMGEPMDGRTDIFSLGVVAFEMLSGEQPFPGNNVTSILYKLLHADPVRPTNLEVLGLLPDKWYQVFSKVLAKSPDGRYGTAAEFVSDLELCLGSWFGALGGETVVMARDHVLSHDTVSSAPAGGLSADEVETVLLPKPAAVDLHPEKKPTRTQHRDETVVLPPRADSGEETKTSPISPIRPIGETETVLLKSTADVETETLSKTEPPIEDADSETIAIPSSALPAKEPPPLTGRTKRGPSPKWSVAWRLILAAVAVAGVAVAVFTLVGNPPEEVTAPVLEYPPPIAEEVQLPAGRLSVHSSPEGAAVWVHGEERGVTPVEISPLPPGLYDVVLEKDGFQRAERRAELTEERLEARIEVTLEPVAAPVPTRATLQIQSEPSGSKVLLDGKPVGETPMKDYRVRAGKRILRVEHEGFRSWEIELELAPGARETISATLDPVASPESEPETAPEPEIHVGDLVEHGPGVVDPRCVDCPTPTYPEGAKRSQLWAVVEVRFVVSETGAVQDIRIEESGGEIFDQAVIAALKSWRFQPGTKKGVPVKVQMPARRFRFEYRR